MMHGQKNIKLFKTE